MDIIYTVMMDDGAKEVLSSSNNTQTYKNKAYRQIVNIEAIRQ